MSNHRGPVPEWLNSSYIEKILQEFRKSPTLTVKSINISAGSKEGDNYACQIYRILVHYKENYQENKISLIGKYRKITALTESYDQRVDPFIMEEFFFSKVYPLLNEEVYEYLPKMLHVDPEHFMVVMEDLKEENFTMQPTGKMVSKQQAALVMAALGTFHGCTYLIDQNDPTLKSQTSLMWSEIYVPDVIRMLYYNAQKVMDAEVGTYGLPEKYVKVLGRFIKDLEKQWFKVCELQEDHINVLLHGDIWMNNCLFKFSEKGAEAVKLLDFQTIGYNSFAHDLSYFLFTSVDANDLLNNLDELLQIYYQHLQRAAPDIPGLSFERIKKEFAERYYFGYCVAISIRSFIYSPIPPDLEALLRGETLVLGLKSPKFAEDLKILMPFFENAGVFNS